MSGRNRNVFVFVILFSILNLQMCCGTYDCYRLSSGKNICFMFDGSPKNFEASKLFCQNNGGFLLEIYNEEMQIIVENFGRNNNLVFMEVWLNLLRTDTNMWLWGGEGSGIYMHYSNWEFPPTYTEEFNNNAVLENNYKWIKTYDSRQASTICIQGSRELYLPGNSTGLFGINTIKYKTALTTTTTKLAAFTTLAWLFYGWTTSGWIMTTKETITTVPNIEPLDEPTRSAYITSTSSLNWYTLSESSTSLSPKVIGIVAGVVIGGLVFTIASSLLIAKFVFYKKIPLPFKSSRNRNSPPHQTGSDVINGVSGHIGEKRLKNRSPTKVDVIMSDTEAPPPYSTVGIGFKYLIQQNSASGFEGHSRADYGPSLAQTFGRNVYDNATN